MSLPRFKIWDGEMLHDVSELHWVAGGVKWWGPGVGSGWAFINPDFFWGKEPIPKADLLLEVVENYADAFRCI